MEITGQAVNLESTTKPFTMNKLAGYTGVSLKPLFTALWRWPPFAGNYPFNFDEVPRENRTIGQLT